MIDIDQFRIFITGAIVGLLVGGAMGLVFVQRIRRSFHLRHKQLMPGLLRVLEIEGVSEKTRNQVSRWFNE